jgi:hypothetical protein
VESGFETRGGGEGFDSGNGSLVEKKASECMCFGLGWWGGLGDMWECGCAQSGMWEEWIVV